MCTINPLILHRVFFLTPKSIDGKKPTTLKFAGGWLLTSPEDEVLLATEPIMPDINSETSSVGGNTGIQVGRGLMS